MFSYETVNLPVSDVLAIVWKFGDEWQIGCSPSMDCELESLRHFTHRVVVVSTVCRQC